jgi:hypothetical protein
MSWLSQEINKVESTPLGKVVTAVAVAVAAPAVGAALGLTGVAAAAAGGAVTSAGIAAAAGDTTKQIENAAATGAVGGAVGAAVGGGAPTDIVSGAEAGAASGAASGATQAALTGQNIGQAAVKGAETGGVVGGVSSGLTNLTNQVAAGGQPISQPVTNYAEPGGPPIETTVQANYNIAPQYSQYTPGGLGLAGTPGATDVYAPLGAATYAPAAQNIEDINLGANYSPNTPIFTPGGVDYSLTSALPSEGISGTPSDAFVTPVPGLSSETLQALKSVYGAGLGILLGGKQPGIGYIGASTTGAPSTKATAGETTGTTGGAPGGTELDPSTGKAPQLVWGDKYSSLKEGLNL